MCKTACPWIFKGKEFWSLVTYVLWRQLLSTNLKAVLINPGLRQDGNNRSCVRTSRARQAGSHRHFERVLDSRDQQVKTSPSPFLWESPRRLELHTLVSPGSCVVNQTHLPKGGQTHISQHQLHLVPVILQPFISCLVAFSTCALNCSSNTF